MTSTWLVFVLAVALSTASPPKFVTPVEPAYDDSTDPPTTDSELLADQADDYDDDDPADYDPEYDEEDLQSDYLSEDRPEQKPPKRIDLNKNKPVNLAKDHFNRMKSLTSCHYPQPKVVKVLEHHPSSSKTYVPACTVLHHCSESTGCCPIHQRCGPKRSEKLELPFFVVHQVPGPDPRRSSSIVKVETLVFYNHTECGCHERGDEMPRDPTPTPPEKPLNPYTECKCPAPFNPRLESGYCTCDCFDKQHDCIKYKRGRDYLNHQERLCIEMRKCKLPSCDYGVYMRRFGRCPRKDEKFRFQ